MNMFKSRRKAKEQSDALEALTGGQSPPTMYKSAKGMKKRNKNFIEESKPKFDLSTALPDDQNFRTSLLMPNLSARFSMLREQDDPNTKLGKASDDSVLFPKRASKMNLFNSTPLADVAEVESIHSTFRPPFAERDRSHSFGDGYDSDNGSMMSRARPGEGNNLFGGRQKLYKIPTSSTRNLADSSGTINGRHIYEQDVALSQFQLYRLKQKEAQAAEDAHRTSVPGTDGGDSSEIASPATAFSKNRGTQSSTNSGPRRTSTAATSVASESPAFRDSGTDAFVIKPNETAHVPENQSTIPVIKTREDPIPNRFASPSKSIIDRSQRQGAIFSSFRNVSSPVTNVAQPLDFGFKTESRSASATSRYQTDSPTPSNLTEADEVLASNLQPNDRGKATALGLFNKPAREFDEQQFNQRQRQMHEGNVSSLSNNSRSTSRASNEASKERQFSLPLVTSASPVPDERTSTPQVPPVPETSDSPVPNSQRASKASARSPPPRPRSKSVASATATANVKARVESLIRKQNAELLALEAEKLGTSDTKTPIDPSENKENLGAFFNNADDESEYEDANDYDADHASSKLDESDIHPAFRNSFRVSETQSRKSSYSNLSKSRSIIDDDHRESSRLQVPARESDTIGQQASVGLSGLIRTHLRTNSDRSSIWPRPDSSVVPTPLEDPRPEFLLPIPKLHIESLHPSLDDSDNAPAPQSRPVSNAPPTPTTAMSQVAQRFLSQAMAMRDANEQDQAEIPANVEEEPQPEKAWREELEPKHQRGASSETTKERREFDEELARRRRKIRDDLKRVSERERSQSPNGTAKGQSVAMQAFVQQRAVTDPQPKAIKMLGIQTRNGQPIDEERGRNTGSRGESRGRMPDTGFHNTKHTATFARFGPDTHSAQSSPRSATPPAARYGRRERSNSGTGDRSKSRSRQKEANPPMPNGNFANWNLPSPSPGEHPKSASDSKPASRGGFIDSRSPPPDLMTRFPVRPSVKPSPITPQSPYDSSMEPSRPSPGPYSSDRMTPPNGRATPTNAFGRKRSVTKTMISEPTFVSSTSSVPLVHLPTAQLDPANAAPPLPMMNPRRRGNTTGEKPILSPISSAFARSTPLEPVPASPIIPDFSNEGNARPSDSPSPKKLRKANSEGGSMAAKARQQAMMAELAQEKIRSPALPIFPNRSATTLPMTADGAMF